MRRETKKNNLLRDAKSNSLSCDMRAIAAKDQFSVPSFSNLVGLRVKYFLKPFKTKLIISLNIL